MIFFCDCVVERQKRIVVSPLWPTGRTTLMMTLLHLSSNYGFVILTFLHFNVGTGKFHV